MTEQEILAAVQDIFRDNFDDDTLEITRATCADDIKFKLSDVRGLKDVGDLLDLVARMV